MRETDVKIYYEPYAEKWWTRKKESSHIRGSFNVDLLKMIRDNIDQNGDNKKKNER